MPSEREEYAEEMEGEEESSETQVRKMGVAEASPSEASYYRRPVSLRGPGQGGAQLVPGVKKPSDKSEWWVIDGKMHEIGENVPSRERFTIPRDIIPNRRRKQMRIRLVLKETAPDPSALEKFIGKIPMVFNVVILTSHGYFGQANVLGLPDTGEEHEPWCKRYMELYQELRENWEILYWDEG